MKQTRVRVRAGKRAKVQNRVYTAGQEFDCSVKMAEILIWRGVVEKVTAKAQASTARAKRRPARRANPAIAKVSARMAAAIAAHKADRTR